MKRKKIIASILIGALCIGMTSCSVPSFRQETGGITGYFQGTQVPELPQIVLEEAPDTTVSEIDLEITQELEITRPMGSFTTQSDTYFVTGVSDPSQPLYYTVLNETGEDKTAESDESENDTDQIDEDEDDELIRQGDKGTFGLFVTLEPGENVISFRQNNTTKSVVITQGSDSSGGTQEGSSFNTITQSSMTPAVDTPLDKYDTVTLSCVAPAGAEVTATFYGETYYLEQVVPEAEDGIPASFRAPVVLEEDFPTNEITALGEVEYTLNYNGQKQEFVSDGAFYLVGKNTQLAVEVSSYVGFIYPDLEDLSIFKEQLKNGAVDYVDEIGENYFKLASGGWIPRDMVQIMTGVPNVDNEVAKVKKGTTERSEYYVLMGNTKPAYDLEQNGEEVSVTIYNTIGGIPITLTDNSIFSSVEMIQQGNTLRYLFTLKNESDLWGYNVSYAEGDMFLEFRHRPVLSTDSEQPLAGLRILLDPGHGGTDGGALGVAGSEGPEEKDVNLAHAYAIQEELEKQGATVYLTRYGDYYYSLDDRLRDQEYYQADIFLSIHHNSIAVTSDANPVRGMEIYYHTDYSQQLGDIMMESLVANLNRKERFVSQSYYRVTLLPYAPSLLMELGFMSNPADYEEAATQESIDMVAQAVAEGIYETISST